VRNTLNEIRISASACLPKPGIGEMGEIFEIDLSVKVKIGYVAVSARLPDDITGP